jgi:hypothetical protein
LGDDPLASLYALDQAQFSPPFPGFSSSVLLDGLSSDTELFSETDAMSPSVSVGPDMDLLASLNPSSGPCTDALRAMAQPALAVGWMDALSMQCFSGSPTSHDGAQGVLDSWLQLWLLSSD